MAHKDTDTQNAFNLAVARELLELQKQQIVGLTRRCAGLMLELQRRDQAKETPRLDLALGTPVDLNTLRSLRRRAAIINVEAV